MTPLPCPKPCGCTGIGSNYFVLIQIFFCPRGEREPENMLGPTTVPNVFFIPNYFFLNVFFLILDPGVGMRHFTSDLVVVTCPYFFSKGTRSQNVWFGGSG